MNIIIKSLYRINHENLTEVNTYGVGKQCRVVWEENTVAFRCFSCSLSPFTAICVDCFLNGNHEGW